ncbi:MAG: hypothetical protein QX197_14055 [Methylococcaceae bacterium]
MKILRKIMRVSCCLMLCLGLQSPWAAEVATQYRFEGMLPSTQLWDSNHPNGTAIAVALDGSLWRASNINSPIQHVHEDGRLISQFSLVYSIPTNAGYADMDIALAPDGSIWVVINLITYGSFECSDCRQTIQHYSAVGKLIKSVGIGSNKPFTSTSTTSWSSRLAIAADGSLWVTNLGGTHLQHITAEGVLIAKINNPNHATVEDYQRYYSKGVAIASDGSIWVADVPNQQLQHFAADGQFIAALNHYKDKGYEEFAITITGDGSIWIGDQMENGSPLRLQHLHTDGSLIAQFRIDGYQNAPPRLAAATDNSVWLTTNDTVQHIKADGSKIAHYGAGSGIGQFNSPSKLELAPDKSVWVLDANDRLQHFNAQGAFIAEIAKKPLLLIDEHHNDFAVAKDGSLWVLNHGSKIFLQHLSADGQLIDSVTIPEVHGNIATIAIASDGSLWINSKSVNFDIFESYFSKSIVQHFSLDGRVILAFAADEGKIRIAADGSLWINDTHYHIDGSVLGKMPNLSNIRPQADGSLWGLIPDKQRIQHVAADGRLLSEFGSIGAAPGQFKWFSSFAVDAEGIVWVADANLHRIQKFVPKSSSNSPADYDDKNGLLYLDDVAVDGTHYQATLCLQDNAFRLLTLFPPLATYTPTARFDAATNLVSIPLARAFGQDYQAQFKYLGDSLFELTTATPLKP